MIIELSDFFNNPSLIELGPLKIQYYAVTWLLSAVLIYAFLKNNRIVQEIGLNKDCLLYTSPSPRDQRGSRMPSSA